MWAELFEPGSGAPDEIDALVSYAAQGHYNVIMPEIMAYHDNNGVYSPRGVLEIEHRAAVASW